MRQLFTRLMILLVTSSFGSAVQSDENNEWQFELKFPMIWAADVDGTINIEDKNLNASRSFKETIDTLTFGLMTEFHAQKGPWHGALKLNYEDSEDDFVSEEFSVPPGIIPIVPRHKIETNTQQGTADAIVGYEFDNGLQLFTGVRHVFSKIDMKITPLKPGIIEIDGKFNVANEKLYDWLVGAQYQYSIAPKWALRLSADIAIAGDNDKDYSTEMSINYRISKLNSAWIGYRYLRIADEFTEEGLRIETDFVTKGPMFGWTFSF